MANTFRMEAIVDPLSADTALVATPRTATNGTAGILAAAKSAGTASTGDAKKPVLRSYGPAAEIAISAMDKLSARRPRYRPDAVVISTPCGVGLPCLDRFFNPRTR